MNSVEKHKPNRGKPIMLFNSQYSISKYSTHTTISFLQSPNSDTALINILQDALKDFPAVARYATSLELYIENSMKAHNCGIADICIMDRNLLEDRMSFLTDLVEGFDLTKVDIHPMMRYQTNTGIMVFMIGVYSPKKHPEFITRDLKD